MVHSYSKVIPLQNIFPICFCLKFTAADSKYCVHILSAVTFIFPYATEMFLLRQFYGAQ